MERTWAEINLDTLKSNIENIKIACDNLNYYINLFNHLIKEKVEDVLHKYFGKNVKFKHDDIKCYAGEVVYTYDEATGYTKKEHNGHGGPGSLESEVFYVSSEVNGNKVKFITKNLYERFCSDICGPMDAYYGRVDDVFENKNAVLKAEKEFHGYAIYNAIRENK